LHQYLGIGVGEQLGYLFTGFSSVLIGVGVMQGTALDPQIVRLRRGHVERQADRERGSFTRPRAQNQTPTHRFSQTAGYEQAQAETACGLGQSGIGAVEALEHVLLVVDRDPIAPILHRDVGEILEPGQPNDHRGSLRRVLERIRQQVGDDLAQTERVGDDPDRALRTLEPNLAGRRQLARVRDLALQERTELHGNRVHRQVAGIEA
jgi:hypothetical protein